VSAALSILLYTLLHSGVIKRGVKLSTGEIILYQTEDGLTKVNLRAIDGTVWLTQLEIAQLFDTSKQNVSLHLQNVFDQYELSKHSVVKESLTTAADGKQYKTKFYNLDAIMTVTSNHQEVLSC